jgi:hypothetical protein
MAACNTHSEPSSVATRFEVCTADQKRRVTPQIKREFKRCAAIELIGHFAQADILIEDGKIRKVWPDIAVSGDAAAVVDAQSER